MEAVEETPCAQQGACGCEGVDDFVPRTQHVNLGKAC